MIIFIQRSNPTFESIYSGTEILRWDELLFFEKECWTGIERIRLGGDNYFTIELGAMELKFRD